MPKIIQIHNVSDKLYKKLELRALEQDISLADYLLNEITLVAEKPSIKDLIKQFSELPAVELETNPVDIIRKKRDLGF